ncbi:MAG: hypothetical protein ACTSQJ_03470 [Promethearchaeota archaeon]
MQIIYIIIGAYIVLFTIVIFTPEIRDWRFGLLIYFSISPLGFAFLYFFYNNLVIKSIENNINHFRAFQKYCYNCGADIINNKKAKNCPNCNIDLDFITFLLEIRDNE